MKSIRTKEIDGYDVILGLSEPVLDHAATLRRAVSELVKAEEPVTPSAISSEMQKNPVYFDVVKGHENVTDEDADEISVKLQALSKFEKLTIGGLIVSDFRGRRWFVYRCGRWQPGQILKIGELLPEGAIWGEDLTPEQRSQIHNQEDSDRIEGLGEEERELEANAAIRSAMGDAVRMRSELEIMGDPGALEKSKENYARRCHEIRKKYKLLAD